MLLCHFDKQSSRINQSASRTEFYKCIANKLSQLSEALDALKRLESSLELSVDQTKAVAILKEYESIIAGKSKSHKSLRDLIEPRIFEWIIRARPDLSEFSHLINTSRIDILIRENIIRTIKDQRDDSSKIQGRASRPHDIHQSRSQQLVDTKRFFPAKELNSQLVMLSNAPERGLSFIDTALAEVYHDLETWKIVSIQLVLPMGETIETRNIPDSIIVKRFREEDSLWEILMLDDTSNKQMRLSQNKSLVYEVQTMLLRKGISLAEKVKEMNRDLYLIESVTQEFTGTLDLDSGSFGIPGVKANHLNHMKRLCKSWLPGAQKCLELFKNLREQFLSQGILQASDPLEELRDMGYSAEDLAGSCNDSSARRKLEILLRAECGALPKSHRRGKMTENMNTDEALKKRVHDPSQRNEQRKYPQVRRQQAGVSGQPSSVNQGQRRPRADKQSVASNGEARETGAGHIPRRGIRVKRTTHANAARS
jgi:hypothetical protein